MNTQTRPSRKVLIIKTGYTETLTNEPFKEGQVSLGDVLRTTALLHLYRHDFVIWLTDAKAVPLLKGNPLIREVLEFNNTNLWRLRHEYFDIVINLEKNAGICALASSIQAWQKYGFRFEPWTGTSEAYNEAIDALYMARDVAKKASNGVHWLAHLFKMVGQEWGGEGYLLDEPIGFKYGHHIVGLNWRIGDKFPEKSWPMDNWLALESRLKLDGYTIDMQPMEDNLEDYIQWISSNSCIISCDSLGLHLGMALNKAVVGLFGPTPAKEIHPYAKGIMIQRASMNEIDVETVYQAVKSVLNEGLC